MFTDAEIAEVKTAIKVLLTGAVEVQIGDKRWRKSELSQLRETYDWMIRHKQGATVTKCKFSNKELLR